MRPIDFFDRAARLYAARRCLVGPSGTLTFDETYRLTHRIGNGLRELGLTKGETFSVLSPNHLMVLPAIIGGLRIGAIHTVLAPGHAIGDSIAFLRINECRVLFYHQSFAEHLPQVEQEVPSLRHLIRLDSDDASGGLEQWAAPQADMCPDFDWQPDEVAIHAGSGGTTGVPKSTMLTNANFSALVATFLSSLSFDEETVNLIAIPASHAGGFLALVFLSAGATNVVLPKADPLAIMEAIEQHRVTTLFLPPTVIYMMLAHPRVRTFDYGSLRHFIYAAAPMSPEKLATALETFGPVMVQTYGQAESPSILTLLTQADHVAALGDPAKRKRLASCGRPTLFSQVAIMDDDGDLLPPGQAGEVVCRGDLVMKGYFGAPDLTAAIRHHGWQRTGDVGYLDENGFLYIVDRKKDMIITGGYNVFPSEIERHLLAHPDIRECAVIGVPDEKWGEAIKAVVELRPGAAVTEADIIHYCRGPLGGVKTPKSVEFSAALPRNPVGKILKREIRDRYWKDRTRRI